MKSNVEGSDSSIQPPSYAWGEWSTKLEAAEREWQDAQAAGDGPRFRQSYERWLLLREQAYGEYVDAAVEADVKAGGVQWRRLMARVRAKDDPADTQLAGAIRAWGVPKFAAGYVADCMEDKVVSKKRMSGGRPKEDAPRLSWKLHSMDQLQQLVNRRQYRYERVVLRAPRPRATLPVHDITVRARVPSVAPNGHKCPKDAHLGDECSCGRICVLEDRVGTAEGWQRTRVGKYRIRQPKQLALRVVAQRECGTVKRLAMNEDVDPVKWLGNALKEWQVHRQAKGLKKGHHCRCRKCLVDRLRTLEESVEKEVVLQLDSPPPPCLLLPMPSR